MEIILAYPSWFLLLCLLAGATSAALVYYGKLKSHEGSTWMRYTLPALRGLAVFILAFLLLEPLVKQENTHTEEPILAVLHDNSQSIRLTADSSFYSKKYPGQVNNALGKLNEKFEVHTFSFGEEVRDSLRFSHSEKITDVSTALDKIQTAFFNRNLGAIVISTDGIFNRGLSPLSSISRFKLVPFYTVGLGDTSRVRDARISNVLYNQTAYLGNDFPIEATMVAQQMKGERLKVAIKKDGTELSSKTITIPSDNYSVSIPFLQHAEKPGLFRYQVMVEPVKSELTTRNNYSDAIIRVIENKQKVLLVSNSPHPDVAAIRLALEKSQQYETEATLATQVSPNLDGYALLILNQLPSAEQSMLNLYKDALKRNTPVWIILGQQTSGAALNSLKAGVSVRELTNGSTQAQPGINASFSLFNMEEELRSSVAKWPPLSSPFSDFKTSPGSDIFLYQQIGHITTKSPLFFFTRTEGTRIAITCGEGMWRWKMKNVESKGNSDLFDNLVRKTAQFLVSSGNRSRFRVNHKPNFAENEPVIFDAELFNESFEPVNDPDVNMTITSAAGKEYRYVFSKSGKSYRLDAGRFSPGIYKCAASVTLGGKKLGWQGDFSVTNLNQELATITADHALLYKLSTQTKGKFYTPRQWNKLAEDLLNRKDIAPTLYSQKELTDLLHAKWLFFIAVLMLTTEWFLRKWSGKY
ncbi:MAG: hypothetical protein ACHQF2_07535 [Flavobacteriales bacterium]